MSPPECLLNVLNDYELGVSEEKENEDDWLSDTLHNTVVDNCLLFNNLCESDF